MAPLRIRKYPHFDGTLTLAEAKSLVTNPEAVSKHPFFPFIESAKRWTKFSVKGAPGVTKDRPIRYAARKDACIFSHYRDLLLCPYEAKLKSLGIQDNVIAYRRIPKGTTLGNKSNIDFANDVFEQVAVMGCCKVYALDIEGFFENIDHAKLKVTWSQLLNVKRLPDDHHAVFKNVTRFSWVDREKLYKALGFIGKKKRADGKEVIGYLQKQVPMQVCDGKRFRKFVSPLIQTKSTPRGIPQGSPISDVLANMYLLDFDVAMASSMASCGGKYYRYSDDILLIVPDIHDDEVARLEAVQSTLNYCGEKLLISVSKSTVHRFDNVTSGSETTQTCTLVHGTQGKNGLEYLGFRFDGKRVYIRDSTRAGLNRKIVAASRKLARLHVKANPQKSISELENSFNYNYVMLKFGRVDDFAENTQGYRGWTFWTYALRAESVFGTKGKPILRQLSSYKAFVRRKVQEAIAAYAK